MLRQLTKRAQALQAVTPLSLKLESYLREKGLGRRVAVGVLRIETCELMILRTIQPVL